MSPSNNTVGSVQSAGVKSPSNPSTTRTNPESITLSWSKDQDPSDARVALAGHLFPPHQSYTIPTAATLGLEGALRAADVWSDLGQMLKSNVTVLSESKEGFAHHYPGHKANIWFDMARLWLNTSGALLLATNALLEVEGLLGPESSYPFPWTAPQLAAFITEAAGQQLVSAGHCLANIAVRLALEDSTAVWLDASSKSTKNTRKAIEAGDAPRDAFIFMGSLSNVSSSLESGASAPFMTTVTRLSEAPDWIEMHRQRDNYFHRIRDDFSRIGPESIESARSFLATTVAGARCIGRAASPLYHQFLDASPNSIPYGTAMMPQPLYGPILVADLQENRQSRDIGEDIDFRPIIERIDFQP